MMWCPNGGMSWASCVGATRVIPSHPFWIQQCNCAASGGHDGLINCFCAQIGKFKQKLGLIGKHLHCDAHQGFGSEGAYYPYPLAHIFNRHDQDLMLISPEQGHFKAAYSDSSPKP